MDYVMLPQARVNQIDAKVYEVLTALHEDIEKIKPPIPLRKLLQEYGIGLKTGNFEDKNVSGAYEQGTKTIFVEKDEPYTRKNFTIAHELGHFFLHNDKKAEFFYRAQVINMDDEASPEEKEANWFAASLLMPEALIYNFWDLTKDVNKLSIIFAVSPAAVYFRLKNLKLIE